MTCQRYGDMKEQHGYDKTWVWEVGRCQFRKDLGCYRVRGIVGQMHGYGSELDIWRAWWKGRCQEIGADEWYGLLKRPPISLSVCGGLWSCGAMSHSRMWVCCDIKWRTFDMAQCLREFGFGVHVTLLLISSFLCLFVLSYIWLPVSFTHSFLFLSTLFWFLSS